MRRARRWREGCGGGGAVAQVAGCACEVVDLCDVIYNTNIEKRLSPPFLFCGPLCDRSTLVRCQASQPLPLGRVLVPVWEGDDVARA